MVKGFVCKNCGETFKGFAKMFMGEEICNTCYAQVV